MAEENLKIRVFATLLKRAEADPQTFQFLVWETRILRRRLWDRLTVEMAAEGDARSCSEG